ncbi:MAG: response regulator [Alphaproteobacteria bacterium]|nr:response regulator [Alphaproteobacteria bacterium]MBU0859043.1 response regulator [Alphaproteobacteria bacterium]
MGYDFKSARVLIIDDMQPMLSLVMSLLKIFGFKDVHIAHDAEEGFRAFCQLNPDIVITDWQMEPFDGIELIRKIRNDKKSPNRFVPVILMSGYSHRGRVEKARDGGMTEFLVKPFNAKDLYRRIEQLIEKPRKFVEADQFFGPDRRRRAGDEYGGPLRRDADEFKKIRGMEGEKAAKLLQELKQQVSETGRSSGDNDGGGNKK